VRKKQPQITQISADLFWSHDAEGQLCESRMMRKSRQFFRPYGTLFSLGGVKPRHLRTGLLPAVPSALFEREED